MCFFQTFQGFPKPPSFWQRIWYVTNGSRVEELLPVATGDLRVAGRAAWLGLGILSVFFGVEVDRGYGCHTDSSYFHIFSVWYSSSNTYGIWMNMFRGRSNINEVTYQNEWWFWWCVWSPLLGVETCPNLNSCAVLPFWGYPKSIFQLRDG